MRWHGLSLLDERPHHNHSPTRRHHVEGSGNSRPSGEPHFPHRPTEVFHVGLAHARQARYLDEFCNTHEPRPHVRWQRCQLGVHGLVQRLNCPRARHDKHTRSGIVAPDRDRCRIGDCIAGATRVDHAPRCLQPRDIRRPRSRPCGAVATLATPRRTEKCWNSTFPTLTPATSERRRASRGWTTRARKGAVLVHLHPSR